MDKKGAVWEGTESANGPCAWGGRFKWEIGWQPGWINGQELLAEVFVWLKSRQLWGSH